MKLDEKRLRELTDEILEFVDNSFECEEDDDESITAFEKEREYFINDWLYPSLYDIIYSYLNYEE